LSNLLAGPVPEKRLEKLTRSKLPRLRDSAWRPEPPATCREHLELQQEAMPPCREQLAMSSHRGHRVTSLRPGHRVTPLRPGYRGTLLRRAAAEPQAAPALFPQPAAVEEAAEFEQPHKT
jgi:hypothetical protein